MDFSKYHLNPTILFVLSFLFLIALGTALLMLPIATYGNDLSFLDALFTSTSAVCVTGLLVIDFTRDLTPFGVNVILLLIQLGGLGIMTFTSFFAYLISGQSSYKNQIMFAELLNDKNMNSIIRSVMNIVILTFIFEILGMILIFVTTDNSQFESLQARLYFAFFHAISAFCNAGFSTLPQGLYTEGFRFSYGLHLVIAMLFILGGLGFTIIVNVQLFLRRWAKLIYYRIRYARPFTYKAWVMTFNSRLIAYSTVILLLFGFVLVFAFEYNSTLSEHPTIFGKAVTAFFAGAVPRTSGFNTFDIAELTFPTLLIMIVLMWIGASPGSTGGGIRTTTFAVAMLNIFNTAKNYERVHIFKREIPAESIRKAFAIIAISLIWITASILALSLTDPDKNLKAIILECFSAYTTAGISLGITNSLSPAGKSIIICSMFVGRVGTITLLVALIRSMHSRKFQYPQEQVLF